MADSDSYSPIPNPMCIKDPKTHECVLLVEDIQIPIPGQSPIVAYGLMAARQLSNNPATQHQALINADSYAVFATMVWMPRTTWTG